MDPLIYVGLGACVGVFSFIMGRLSERVRWIRFLSRSKRPSARW